MSPSDNSNIARRHSRLDFEVGYLTAQYLFGRRSEELGLGLELACPGSQRLRMALLRPERSVRAQSLAAPLARLVAHLTESEL